MASYLWFNREFDFEIPVWMYPNVIERLRGTPARIEELVRPLTTDVLTMRDGKRWSIQEHAGHLWDVESLWDARLDDFEAGRDELKPADLENTRTYEADYNSRDITVIFEGFRAARQRLVGRLDQYDDTFVARSALHPRLKQPMRVLDSAFFAAEHDDHHLARISELIRKSGK
jgi:uncharacterized damage-inducible protein DinB